VTRWLEMRWMTWQAPSALYTSYTLPVHPLCTPYTHPIHTLYHPYTTPIHPLYNPYTPPIHPLYTPYTPPIQRIMRCMTWRAQSVRPYTRAWYEADGARRGRYAKQVLGKGLHSSTFQLDLSLF